MSKYFSDQWSSCVNNDTCYTRFVSVHSTCTKPLLLWSAASLFPYNTKELSFLASLCVSTNAVNVCELCGSLCTDFVTQFFCQCSMLYNKRERFWDFVSRNFDIELEIEIFNKSDEDFTCCILGGEIKFFKNRLNEHLHFLKSCAIIWYMKIQFTNVCSITA